MPENIYRFAAEHALRYPYKGSIATEDLFNLTVKQLDDIHIALKRQLKKNDDESLLAATDKTAEDIELEVKIAIVKDIFDSKQEQAKLRKDALEKQKYNQKIAGIIAEKEDAALRNKSVDELREMLK